MVPVKIGQHRFEVGLLIHEAEQFVERVVCREVLCPFFDQPPNTRLQFRIGDDRDDWRRQERKISDLLDRDDQILQLVLHTC